MVRKTKPSWYVALPNTLEKPWQCHTAIMETRNIIAINSDSNTVQRETFEGENFHKF